MSVRSIEVRHYGLPENTVLIGTAFDVKTLIIKLRKYEPTQK
ncbi:hypothetical protein QYS49_28370 [Marivirga salinae]|uniref:Uncharacterized protein n=1 Tax=Marivirga salinarum TaxID=3059078 RepID=A0AA49GAY8_9BACT|nr:hypothetical protein [Marivirga sp. BDSF4-3]WKK75413.2 hypothetical protein QYS49_28370 [Marivirga sp. BDSF4-3]